jgi:hypothetical protein
MHIYIYTHMYVKIHLFNDSFKTICKDFNLCDQSLQTFDACMVS